MKVLVLLASLATLSCAFQPTGTYSARPMTELSAVQKKKSTKKSPDSFLHEFFSHPFQGLGNGDLDEIYKTQQDVLSARRTSRSGAKLRRKYTKFEQDHLKDIPTHRYDPKLLNQKEDDAMYVDEDGPSFEIPFLKNMNKNLEP